MDVYTTITQKGQVTIPVDFRRKLGLEVNSKVKISIHSNKVLVEPTVALDDLFGILKSDKKFDKKKARAAYMPDLLAGKI
jgi:AbrB family looped-hinge helix DNA binding protein